METNESAANAAISASAITREKERWARSDHAIMRSALGQQKSAGISRLSHKLGKIQFKVTCADCARGMGWAGMDGWMEGWTEDWLLNNTEATETTKATESIRPTRGRRTRTRTDYAEVGD